VAWIENSVVEAIKEKADIVALAEEHLGLTVTRDGIRTFRVPCPYPDHPDSAEDGGSCILKPHYGNSFYCFGCRRGGSLFKFYGLVRGLDLDNDWQRSVVEIHDLFNMGMPGSGSWLQQGAGSDVRVAMDHFVGANLTRTSPLQAVEDGEYWLWSGVHVFRQLSREDRNRFYSLTGWGDGIDYPLVLTWIPSLRLFSLNERSTGRVCGWFAGSFRQTQFTYQFGTAITMAGPSLSGKDVPPDAPRFFQMRYAVENPLDYLAISGIGRPVTLGIWGKGDVDPPVSMEGFNCWVAMHLGNAPSSPRRFRETVQDDQLWLPREYFANGYSSLFRLPESRLADFLTHVQHNSRPVPFRGRHLAGRSGSPSPGPEGRGLILVG